MALILSVPFSLLARLQDCMPPFLGSASGVRGTDETAAAPGSLTTTWTHLLFVLIIVGVVISGGLNPFGFGVSSSARPRSLCGPVPAARVHRPIRGCWSRPLLADHAELAALEQAQLEAARARRGWRPISRALSSHFDKRTHRRSPAELAFDEHLLETFKRMLTEAQEPARIPAAAAAAPVPPTSILVSDGW
jgi:hypothetical protein